MGHAPITFGIYAGWSDPALQAEKPADSKRPATLPFAEAPADWAPPTTTQRVYPWVDKFLGRPSGLLPLDPRTLPVPVPETRMRALHTVNILGQPPRPVL